MLSIEVLKQQIEDFIQANEARLDKIEMSICNFKEDIKDLKENHINHLKSTINELQIKHSQTFIDVKWLKKFFWIVITASLGSLIGAMVNLIIKLT